VIRLIQDAAAAAEDFFFPPACLACGDGRARMFEGGVCTRCWESIPKLAAERCEICDVPLRPPAAAIACGKCLQTPPPFEALKTAAPYAVGARKVLHAFKYRGADYLAPHLARMLASVLRDFPPVQAAVPVPATRREIREKGFFPAGELAREIAILLSIERGEDLLRKVRETDRQVGLPLPRRFENVRGAFEATAPPETVLLVDDVVTSGSTLSACAKALKRAGARFVFAAAFARALPEEN
jgi:predicted amidophosphoribosyltransferase